MNLGEEVEDKFRADPEWGRLPYEYAVMCIALDLSFAQAYDGFCRRMTPEEIMFEVMDFTSEQIREWQRI